MLKSCVGCIYGHSSARSDEIFEFMFVAKSRLLNRNAPVIFLLNMVRLMNDN